MKSPKTDVALNVPDRSVKRNRGLKAEIQLKSWLLAKKKKRGKKDAGMSSCGESIGALLYFTVWHKSLIIDVLRIKKPLTVLA